MARVFFSISNIDGNALTASTAKTFLQLIAPAAQRVAVRRVVVSFQGITVADPPVLVELLLQTDGGSGSTAVTAFKTEQSISTTVVSTAIRTPSSEPAGTTTFYHREFVHEQTGCVLSFPGEIIVKEGERLGVRFTPATLTATTDAMVTMYCEE